MNIPYESGRMGSHLEPGTCNQYNKLGMVDFYVANIQSHPTPTIFSIPNLSNNRGWLLLDDDGSHMLPLSKLEPLRGADQLTRCTHHAHPLSCQGIAQLGGLGMDDGHFERLIIGHGVSWSPLQRNLLVIAHIIPLRGRRETTTKTPLAVKVVQRSPEFGAPNSLHVV